MTDEQWEMIQKTPEWAAAAEAHFKAISHKRRVMERKWQRRKEALDRRYQKEKAALSLAMRRSEDAFAEWANELENKGILEVFAHYGVEPAHD